MPVTVEPDTPLAQALNDAVQPKLVEVGWSTGGGDDSALAEYVILMLVNGKSQEQIASELSNDLLGLGPDDTEAVEFAKWLFEQVEVLDRKINGGGEAEQKDTQEATQEPGQTAETAQTSQVLSQQGQQQEGTQQQQGPDGQAPQGTHEVPTGPRAQRQPGPQNQHARGRMMGHINKAMDRSNDFRIHGAQGLGRGNAQWDNQRGSRNQRRGGGMFPGRQNGVPPHPGMNMNMPTMPGPNGQPMMPMDPQQQMQMMALLEEQARMMAQIMPGFVRPAINPNFKSPGAGQKRGRSLFERTEFQDNKRRGNWKNNRDQQASASGMGINTNGVSGGDAATEGDASKPSADPNGVCKWNLKCRNTDCPYAHQSPAAPEGTPVDPNDECPYGVACKNRKCVCRHPSPAKKSTHQSEELCRFFPNCANPNCHFKHPSTPMCRNGGDCKVPNCQFTHLQIPCKFNPCLNPSCPFKHAEGQKGAFQDKVWTPSGYKPHVSERRFVNEEGGEEELIKPGNEAGVEATANGTTEANAEEHKEENKEAPATEA